MTINQFLSSSSLLSARFSSVPTEELITAPVELNHHELTQAHAWGEPNYGLAPGYHIRAMTPIPEGLKAFLEVVYTRGRDTVKCRYATMEGAEKDIALRLVNGFAEKVMMVDTVTGQTFSYVAEKQEDNPFLLDTEEIDSLFEEDTDEEQEEI